MRIPPCLPLWENISFILRSNFELQASFMNYVVVVEGRTVGWLSEGLVFGKLSVMMMMTTIYFTNTFMPTKHLHFVHDSFAPDDWFVLYIEALPKWIQSRRFIFELFEYHLIKNIWMGIKFLWLRSVFLEIFRIKTLMYPVWIAISCLIAFLVLPSAFI